MTLPHDDRDAGPRRDELDALLDLDRDLAVPRDLAARVLGGLRASEERALDALLAAGHDRAADAPPDLAARVLAAVRAEERAVRNRRKLTWLPGGTLPRVAAAAVVVVTAFGAWRLASPPAADPAGAGAVVADVEAAAPAELLELLPVLERWDLVTGGDGDGALDPADLDTLAALEGEDELLLLLGTEDNG